MIRVFLGGSRAISRLPPSVKARLDGILAQEHEILVGDASGADKAFQRALLEAGDSSVRVFHSGAACRNNLGGWPAESVPTDPRLRGRAFYTVKDVAMAERATHGFMLWDGTSEGTLRNVLNLADRAKPCLVFILPEENFLTIRSRHEFDALAALPGAPRLESRSVAQPAR